MGDNSTASTRVPSFFLARQSHIFWMQFKRVLKVTCQEQPLTTFAEVSLESGRAVVADSGGRITAAILAFDVANFCTVLPPVSRGTVWCVHKKDQTRKHFRQVNCFHQQQTMSYSSTANPMFLSSSLNPWSAYIKLVYIPQAYDVL